MGSERIRASWGRQRRHLLPHPPPPLHPTFVSYVVIKSFSHNVLPNNFGKYLWENLIYSLNTLQVDPRGTLKAGVSRSSPHGGRGAGAGPGSAGAGMIPTARARPRWGSARAGAPEPGSGRVLFSSLFLSGSKQAHVFCFSGSRCGSEVSDARSSLTEGRALPGLSQIWRPGH